MDQAIKEFQDSLKLGQVEFHHKTCSVPGTRVIEVTHEDCMNPIGLLYYSFVGNNTIQILQSYVIEQARRCNVRTGIHKFLIESYPLISTIITGSANKMSKPWLIKNGFKQNKYKDWVLNLEK